MRTVRHVVVASFVLVLGWPGTALAAKIEVGCSGSELVAAVLTANESPGADTLELAPSCSYVFTATAHGNNALPAITSKLKIVGNDALVARDISVGLFRFLEVGTAVSVSIKDLTISSFRAPPGVSGGGIFNQGSLKLNNVSIIANRAGVGAAASGAGGFGGDGGHGGGIFNTQDAVLKAKDIVLSSNIAGTGGACTSCTGGFGGLGGGIYNFGKLSLNGTVQMNGAGIGGAGTVGGPGGDGGGIYNATSEKVKIKGSVSFNEAGAAGAFTAGSPNHGDGGGIFNLSLQVIKVKPGTVTDNLGGSGNPDNCSPPSAFEGCGP